MCHRHRTQERHLVHIRKCVIDTAQNSGKTLGTYQKMCHRHSTKTQERHLVHIRKCVIDTAQTLKKDTWYISENVS